MIDNLFMLLLILQWLNTYMYVPLDKTDETYHQYYLSWH